MKVTVVGAGAWGTALAISLCGQHRVTLWARSGTQYSEMAAARSNRRYLPDFPFPDPLSLEADLGRALDQADMVLVVVPTSGFRQALQDVAACAPTLPVVWACKGLEVGSAKLPHQVADEVLPRTTPRGVLSGPSFAKEVAQGLPTALTFASTDKIFAHEAALALHSPRLRLYSTGDVVGVELGGAVKNVMAIAAGISDGMNFGYNARAALITRGLAEMTRLGQALGGRVETFLGLAGVGDLILTCTGDLSRNRQVGIALAQGRELSDILQGLGHVAEGVHTAREVLSLAQRHQVEMPITRAVHQVLYEGLPARTAVEALLNREPKAENHL
jgi:glycerol-3-phosphate dehydrogenase (NAD(P)+)